MMTIEQITRAMEGRNLSALARYTEVSYATIRRIAAGEVTGDRISYLTVLRISNFLENEAQFIQAMESLNNGPGQQE